MDFSIILVGGHTLRNRLNSRRRKNNMLKMNFFCILLLLLLLFGVAVLVLTLLRVDLTHLESVPHSEPDFPNAPSNVAEEIVLKAPFDYCIHTSRITWAELWLRGQKYVSRARGGTQTARRGSHYIMEAVIMAFH